MQRRNALWLGGFAELLAIALAGCGVFSSATGVIDRTLNVNGSVRLELTDGSDDSRVTVGSAGIVRIRAKFQFHAWPWENAQEKARQIAQSPPIEQDQNLIRIGAGRRPGDVTFDYSIEVPANTEVHAVTGSGDLQVVGIHGPANLIAGSGDITASGIGNDTSATAGSGNIQLSDIQGEVEAVAGSGDIVLSRVRGNLRVHTGSGDIRMDRLEGAASASAGSGDVKITDAAGDLRVRTGSGDVMIDGNPAPSSYWQFHTSSGDVSLAFSSNPSFRLHAHSNSGGIESSLPIVIEGKASQHELRAHIGNGQARIEIETSSGAIRLH